MRRGWKTRRVRRTVILSVLGVITFGIAALIGGWQSVCRGNACPSLEGLKEYDPAQASKVYAADGRLITDLGLERRTVIPLKDISPAVVQAFLATEDKRFYEHNGIDWVRVMGAVKGALLGNVTGASTITMQLAGNLFPEDINRRDRTLKRKLREMKVALEIEKRYPKDRILELYLNQIDLGNRAFGVEAAAQRYFGKSSRDLNVAEAATLAAIPKGPSRLNPRRNPARNILRRNVVLNLLRDQHLITEQETERWKAYPLLLTSRSDFTGVADYFVEYVRQQAQALVGARLYSDGLRIYTTLDLDLQQAAEKALEEQLTAIEAGSARLGKFTHQTYAQYTESRAEDAEEEVTTPYLQGLVLSLDAKTGYIRAMVGGRDFDDSKFNRVTQSRRQPGSTFKPIVYSLALERGHPLSELVMDEPYAESIPGQPLWAPQNYDLKFDGRMTLRRALFESRNIPTIKLGKTLGEHQVIDMARRFGISLDVQAVPSIHIGSADVVPMEMIAAYSVFANVGERVTPVGILRIEDRAGNIVWQPSQRRQRVLARNVSWLMTDVLRDVVRVGTARGSVGAQINFPAGGKTGTTNDYFDVWFVGFTTDMVTGVWIGFDQPRKIMANAQGGRLAAPVWTQLMKEAYERRPVPGGWPRPDSLTVAEVDSSTGAIATPFCPRTDRYVESYIPGTEPHTYCPVHSQLLGLPGTTTAPMTNNPALPAGTTAVPAPTIGQPATQPPPPSRGAMGGVGPPPTSVPASPPPNR